METYTATYSPDDNKLRLYSCGRLPKDLYQRVRAAGFKWAPKQDLFVAPMWTPQREDLLIELCGAIDDEDTSLVDRAEERSERFEDYSDKRADDAERAHDAVSAIADNIPMGQPILVGHHSERHARKDAQRIESGMRRAVKMWETSKYWTERAKGAIRHAKYKERPDVRHRRIKKLEADKRKRIAEYTPCPKTRPILQQAWTHDGYEDEKTPHVWCGQGRGGSWVQESRLPAIKTRNQRWINHIDNRLAYERAMLGDAGGLPADQFDLQPGGMVLVRGEWVTITRLNKKDGQVVSVSTNARFVRVKSIEEIRGYKPPTEQTAKAVKRAAKLPPLVNHPSNGFQQMTKAEWKRKCSDFKGTRVAEATKTHGAYRYRSAFVPGGSFKTAPVFLTDAKVVHPPIKTTEPDSKPLPRQIDAASVINRPKVQQPEPDKFDAMKETLKAGVKTVSAPQLFETPPELAARVVKLSGMDRSRSCERILEPSAGTGRLIRAILKRDDCASITALEINLTLADGLRRYEGTTNVKVRCCDFLECNGEFGTFDRIVMNPPFVNGSDIKHIKHAANLLKPGGRLVAICANGPRQRDQLKPLSSQWHELEPGTFKDSGTNVNAAIVVIDQPRGLFE